MSLQLTTELVRKTLDYALTISETKFDGKPFSVAICDSTGSLLAFLKKDGAPLLTIELTQRKAYTSARMGCATKAFLQRLQTENLDIAYFADDKFTALPGGIPLVHEGKRIGAVGCGGISVEGDHAAAEMIAQYILSEGSENGQC